MGCHGDQVKVALTRVLNDRGTGVVVHHHLGFDLDTPLPQSLRGCLQELVRFGVNPLDCLVIDSAKRVSGAGRLLPRKPPALGTPPAGAVGALTMDDSRRVGAGRSTTVSR